MDGVRPAGTMYQANMVMVLLYKMNSTGQHYKVPGNNLGNYSKGPIVLLPQVCMLFFSTEITHS